MKTIAQITLAILIGFLLLYVARCARESRTARVQRAVESGLAKGFSNAIARQMAPRNGEYRIIQESHGGYAVQMYIDHPRWHTFCGFSTMTLEQARDLKAAFERPPGGVAVPDTNSVTTTAP